MLLATETIIALHRSRALDSTIRRAAKSASAREASPATRTRRPARPAAAER
jgi:hypothetical protein